MKEAECIVSRFDEFCKLVITKSIKDYSLLYTPVWQCGNEILSEFECFFLRAIDEHPGITVNELKDYWGKTQGAVSQQLSALEKKGYVHREKSQEDGRRTEVYLTKEGKNLTELVEKMKLKQAEDAVKELTKSGYTEKQIEDFCNIYEKLENISTHNIKKFFL
ncbi:MAG: MarR family transcriptional regulator [Lachnospiraceae bacterium]